MGFLRSALRSSGGSASLSSPPQWLTDFFGGGAQTSSGVTVNENTALHYGPFFAGINVVSGDLGSLPLITYERLDRGKRRAVDHPIYPLLHDAPNELMTSLSLRRTMQGHAMAWGNGYANIVRERGQVTALWPLRPDRMFPKITRTGAGTIGLTYRYVDPVNNIYTTLLHDEVLHISGLGGDGIRGYSLVRLARESIGLGIATEKFGAAWFGNGSRPGGFVKHPGEISDGANKRLAASLENRHRGLDNAMRIAILEEGMEWESVGIPPEDAQFLETRKFSVTEMARWLRLPPHKIGDLERATFSNIEQQALDYITSALRVWFVTWEQGITQRLLNSGERGRYFVEHLADALLRGDIKTRYEAYAIGRNWGWLSADDVNELENRNPLPDDRGAVYLVPLNMVPAPTLEDANAAAAAGRQQSRDLTRVGRGRGVEARRRIAAVFKPLIVDADTRLAGLERDKVTALVAKHLGDRGRLAGRTVETLKPDLDALYRGLIMDKSLERWLPLFSAFAAEIAADAAADVGHTGEIDLERWVAAYARSHTEYRISSSLGQLWRALSGDDPAGAVLGLLDKWVDTRPARTAKWEGNQIPNAAARETWKDAGVRTLKWMTQGDDCPFCQALDGVTVGISDPFVASGGEVGDGGLADKLQVDRNTFHPPLHPGCDCQVVPA